MPEYGNQIQPFECRSTSSVPFTPYNFPANAPVSPRVHDLKQDMDILTMSRNDNPYILSKIEQMSRSFGPNGSGDLMTLRQQFTSPDCIQYDVNCRNNRDSMDDASQSLLWSEDEGKDGRISDDVLEVDDTNLHQHLIRSPPPSFPTNISAFIFPEPGSPLHSACSPLLFSPRRTAANNWSMNKACSESAAMVPGQQQHLTSSDNRPHTAGRTLFRRASAGGHSDALMDDGDMCPKRAASGPNILRSPPEVNSPDSEDAFLPQSDSREVLLQKAA